MENPFSITLDRMIPRGGKRPSLIYTSHEEYLSRLAILNRRLQAVLYRLESWQRISEEHIKLFNKKVATLNAGDSFTQKGVHTFQFSLRDGKVENEFEVLLYSMVNALSSLTRVIACFFEKSTDFHSHSKLGAELKKMKGFDKLCSVVEEAYRNWAKELTKRRDTATHYIALSANSSFKAAFGTSGSGEITTQIGITQKPIRYVSVWQDELPVAGGAKMISYRYENGDEVHEMKDNKDNLIVRRTAKFDADPELVDGREYVVNLYQHFTSYIIQVLNHLTEILSSDYSCNRG